MEGGGPEEEEEAGREGPVQSHRTRTDGRRRRPNGASLLFPLLYSGGDKAKGQIHLWHTCGLLLLSAAKPAGPGEGYVSEQRNKDVKTKVESYTTPIFQI